MVDVADSNKAEAPPVTEQSERRPFPRWVITLASITVALVLWGSSAVRSIRIRFLSLGHRVGVLGVGGHRPIVVGAL